MKLKSPYRKPVLLFLILILLVAPFTFLTAKYVSFQKQLEALRKKYPQFTEEEVAVIEAVKRAQPSVVSVVMRKEVFSPAEKVLDLGNGFQIVVPGELQSRGKQVVGQGSGFVVSKDGLIVTNKHVVSDKNADYQVVFPSGAKFDAVVVARDPVNDLALLKISGSLPALKPLILTDFKEVKIGQTVIAIGNALGEFQNSITKGIVSALNRSISASDGGGQTERLVKIIQTDAAINPGNSGGPLLNARGEVVGINTAVSLGAENIGFAIPAPDIQFVLDSYSEHGKVVRPYMGIRYAAVNADVSRKLGLVYDYGVILVAGIRGEPAVVPGSPAANAGLKESDVILAINGIELGESNDFVSLIRDYKVGQVVELRVWKKAMKKETTVKVTLGEMK